jgi:uncharacterized membrane protein YedE/YeeE
MENFTPLSALIGGILIGISSFALLVLQGRIAGISGILENGLFAWRDKSNRVWAIWFIAGLLLGGEVVRYINPLAFGSVHPHKLWMIVLGGLLVGFGSRLGSGCTSGHGICGLGRLSLRSLIAVLTFMIAGVVSVWLAKLVNL